MNFFNGPTKIIHVGSYRRFFDGKPQLEAVAWFRDHVCWLKNYKVDANNISFILERDPGKNVCLKNGKRLDTTDTDIPNFGCTVYGTVLHTLATTRRNELIFRYNHKTALFPNYPFPGRTFAVTEHFRELMDKLSMLLEHVSEDGTADRLDLLAIEMITEALVSSEQDRRKNAVDPRIEKLAAKLMLYPEKDINISAEAAELGFSRAAFYREWSKYSPETPYHLLLKNRLRIVQTLLKETELPVKEIAIRSGFKNPTVLAESFQRICGTTLHNYRKKN